METFQQQHAKMLCHDCHRFAIDDEGNCVEFIEPETCPRCLCPESKIDILLLMDPMYKCDCGNVILQFSPKMYDCIDCRNGYYDYILKVADVANAMGINYHQIVNFDPLIDNPLIICDGRNHAFSYIDRSVIGDWLVKHIN